MLCHQMHRSVSFSSQMDHFCALFQMGNFIAGECLRKRCPLTGTPRLVILFFSLRISAYMEAASLTSEWSALFVVKKLGTHHAFYGPPRLTSGYFRGYSSSRRKEVFASGTVS